MQNTTRPSLNLHLLETAVRRAHRLRDEAIDDALHGLRTRLAAGLRRMFARKRPPCRS